MRKFLTVLPLCWLTSVYFHAQIALNGGHFVIGTLLLWSSFCLAIASGIVFGEWSSKK